MKTLLKNMKQFEPLSMPGTVLSVQRSIAVPSPILEQLKVTFVDQGSYVRVFLLSLEQQAVASKSFSFFFTPMHQFS